MTALTLRYHHPAMHWAGLITAVALAQGDGEGDDGRCSLGGDGDVERCERVYLRSRLAGLAAPSYVAQTDGTWVHHGLAWTLAVDVPRDEWGGYFALGAAPGALPRGFPFQLGAAATFLWYVGAGFEGRLVLRARVMSVGRFDDPVSSVVHLTVGAGGSLGTLGWAPRIELRARVGHLAWGGVVLAAGFQPYVYKNLYLGDFSVGLEAPWVWWW